MILHGIIMIGDFLGRRGGWERVIWVLLKDRHDDKFWSVVVTI